MNILAIDPGLANFGWCSKFNERYTHGTFLTSPKVSLHLRLSALVLCVPHRHYDYLVVENCFGPAKTKLDYVIGSLITVINHEHLILVAPNKWKRALCPKGKKETYGDLITKLVTKHYGVQPDSQHSADALGLMLWAERDGIKEAGK